MKKILLGLCISLIGFSSMASAKITYLSCPKLDERAPDLIVVLDQSNGTASLQSPSMGSGLNFTAPAAFGPSEVTWRKDSTKFKQTYSVDRATLVLKRTTFSEMSNSTHSDISDCKISKPPQKNKF
ncbi:hypothetical protein [Klebsiella michiganensis]|uniref:hypothetical protein n=1 Tax=Klebsiella michiganensis TaxID=1134687 RepID=UPI001156DC04|nr:hypothetical protein [Klebsiella michiganensis]MBQ4658468.1 hypothetical protein [Klebsiella michiganensis]MBQ4664549.1 hypothetical protein [Klebsiella michiganensis]MBZ7134583.1 hypothetical protein [Klebsiella michiganensis]MDK3154771.1 hypothetical protein [Klebsiella michiganensis]MDV1381324.1 hypothetical protein [Klebsiella michiganensis]